MQGYFYKASVIIPQENDAGIFMLRDCDCYDGDFTPVAFFFFAGRFSCIPVPACIQEAV